MRKIRKQFAEVAMLGFVIRYIRVGVLIGALTGCVDHSFEYNFFQQSFNTAEARMAGYSLEDQYKIFRYGNDVVHPSMIELAGPIAKQGSAAVPFLLTKLAEETDDEGIRDIVLIFREMAFYNYYDVNSDKVVMQHLAKKIESMGAWKDIASEMMGEIKSASKPVGKNCGL